MGNSRQTVARWGKEIITMEEGEKKKGGAPAPPMPGKTSTPPWNQTLLFQDGSEMRIFLSFLFLVLTFYFVHRDVGHGSRMRSSQPQLGGEGL